MELQSAAVSYRIAELRRLARSLRLERRRVRRPSTSASLARIRIVLGRGFLAVGDALLDGTPARSPRGTH